MKENKSDKYSVGLKVVFGLLFTLAFLLGFFIFYYWIKPKYEIIQKYEWWYYGLMIGGWLLSIVLTIFGDNLNKKNKENEKRDNGFNVYDIILFCLSPVFAILLLVYAANSGKVDDNILPSSFKFNVIELSGTLGGLVLAAASIQMDKILQRKLFIVSRYLILATILFVSFTVFTYNANITSSSLVKANAYTNISQWFSVISFYIGSAFLFTGLIKLVGILFNLNKYLIIKD
ncbi:MAG: hypothetical protein PHE50_00770 [Dehalococcoidales bacterium]|nr:hypothetical protein [Dehalococcoidales bacterium]